MRADVPLDRLDRREVTLAAGPAAAAAARATLTRWLAGHVPVEVLEDARLLVSELVANSIGHAELPDEASLRLAVQLRAGALRVEVRDPGASGAIVPREPDRERGDGFGLHLVDLIATRWGVDRTSGTDVWFEVDAVGAERLA